MAGEHILVVDDEPSMLDLCVRILTRQGYLVQGVGTGQEAIASLQAHPYDLVVVDIALPDIDGAEVLRRAREIDPGIAAVAITGYGNMENAIRALRAGAREFVIKPFGLEDFIAMIDEALATRQREQEHLVLRAQLPVLQVSQAWMVEGNIPEMARRILEAVGPEFQAHAGALLLRDEPSGPLLLVGAVGLSQEQAGRLSLPGDEQALDRLFPEGRPRALASAGEWGPPWSFLFSGPKTGALALVPLPWGGRTVGVLALGRPSAAGPFTPAEVNLLSLLGPQVAMALENARLFETVARGKREWERTFDTIADGISLHDADFRITRANRALAERLGTTPAALIGRPCYQVIHRSDRPLEQCPCLKARSSGQMETAEWEESWLEGTFQVSAYPILDETGQLRGLVHVMRDVTAARRLERELVRSEKLAALGRLVAALAHEINNPLQGLRSGFHLLRNPQVGAEKRDQYLEVASRELERLIAIVERILGFYRPAGEAMEPTDLNQVLEETLALAARQLEQSRIAVECRLDRDLPPITGVSDQLKQVFLNVILNALQAMPSGGKLTVQTGRREQGGEVFAVLTDTGTGIPPEEIGRIFEPFYTTRPEGSGLGLAISYGIVERHGGRIEVQSRIGQGSTFTIVLPGASPTKAP